MATYQFAHINAYSRTGSKKDLEPKTTAGCLGEAFREKGFADQVENPKKPVLLFGSREEIETALRAYEEGFRDSRGHRLRKDGKELLAEVFSWPPGTTKKEFEAGLPIVLFNLMVRYGSSLRCALYHEDEPFLDETGKHHGEIHYHIHVFVVPEPEEDFRNYHPGMMAKWQAREKGLNHWEQDKFYKWTMGDWQDEINRKVGIPLGLTRARPKELQEKRLSRREQRIINAAKEKSIQIQEAANKKAEVIENEAKARANEQARLILQNTEKKAKAEAENIIKQALDTAKKEAEKIIHNANVEADKTRNKAVHDATMIIGNLEKQRDKILTDTSKDQKQIISVLKTDLTEIKVPQPKNDETAINFFGRISIWLKAVVKKFTEKEKELNERELELNKQEMAVETQLKTLAGGFGEEKKLELAIRLLKDKLAKLRQPKVEEQAKAQENKKNRHSSRKP
jgi:vacuolar-type H+-ATPase subunit H